MTMKLLLRWTAFSRKTIGCGKWKLFIQFSLLTSVEWTFHYFILIYGYTSMPCKTLVSACFPNMLSLARQVNEWCVYSKWRQTICSHSTAGAADKWCRGDWPVQFQSRPFALSWAYRSIKFFSITASTTIVILDWFLTCTSYSIILNSNISDNI